MSTLPQVKPKLSDLKEKYGLRSFVETGTFEGDALRFALSLGFEKCFSCDIAVKYARAACLEHARNPNVAIWCSDSLAFLRALPRNIGPSFFWLDAHQPREYDPSIQETDANKFPALLELEILKQRPDIGRDVIVIDDLIVIEGSPRWHKGEVSENLQVRSFKYEQLLATLAETHEATYFEGMEGYLLFTPAEYEEIVCDCGKEYKARIRQRYEGDVLHTVISANLVEWDCPECGHSLESDA